MSWDPEHVAQWTRWTARASALLFFLFLSTWAVPRTRPGSPAVFSGFVAMHTVHFAWVLALAWATRGENIAVRGGWAPAVLGGVLFYVGAGLIARYGAGWSADRGWSWPGLLAATLIWLPFAQAYVLRAKESQVTTLWAVAALGSAVAFALAVARRRPVTR